MAFLLIAIAAVIPDPVVFPFRHALVQALVAAGLFAGVASFAKRRFWQAALFASCSALAMWQAAQPGIDRRSVLARTDADAFNIERHFVVGYDDLAAAEELELVRSGQIGGVFLTRRNVAGRTVAQVASQIDRLQAIRRDVGLPRLIVAADQEGDPVSRVSPPLPKPPALSTISALEADERQPAARRLGVAQGLALRQIGVSMDLAPVSDLTPRQAASVFDRNTRIATRSISADPTVIAAVAAGFSAGLISVGITPTAKHFPGLGRVAQDTHLFSASLDASTADLSASDWLPFRAVLDLPSAAVMLSHVALANVDPDVPVSRSKRVVDDMLRKQRGFAGIAITDDLTMGRSSTRVCAAR